MGDRNSDFVEYRSFLFTKDIMSFLKCSIFDQYPKASIYIASDSNFAKGIVLNNTMNHEVFSFTPKATHSDSAFKSTKGNDIVKELFVELLTLGSCDALVGTYRSSFSFLVKTTCKVSLLTLPLSSVAIILSPVCRTKIFSP